jgi:hypothetical protein
VLLGCGTSSSPLLSALGATTSSSVASEMSLDAVEIERQELTEIGKRVSE